MAFVVAAVAGATALTGYLAGEETKKGLSKAGDLKTQGYLTAIDTVTKARDKSVESHQPYADQGKKMVDWFKKYNEDPAFKYDMYTQYAKVGDPLYDYYQAKQSKELNREMAARGRFGGGRAIQAHGEQNATLSAKMADLTDTRVARELSTNMQLLGSGQNAAGAIAGIETGFGAAKGNLELGMFGAQADTAQAIGNASANQIYEIGGAVTGAMTGRTSLGFGGERKPMDLGGVVNTVGQTLFGGQPAQQQGEYFSYDVPMTQQQGGYLSYDVPMTAPVKPQPQQRRKPVGLNTTGNVSRGEPVSYRQTRNGQEFYSQKVSDPQNWTPIYGRI